MTTFYTLDIRPVRFPRIAEEHAMKLIRGLLDLGIVTVNVEFAPEPEPAPTPPEPEVRVVLRYVCSECGYMSSKIGVGVHRRRHEREGRVHRVEVTK